MQNISSTNFFRNSSTFQILILFGICLLLLPVSGSVKASAGENYNLVLEHLNDLDSQFVHPLNSKLIEESVSVFKPSGDGFSQDCVKGKIYYVYQTEENVWEVMKSYTDMVTSSPLYEQVSFHKVDENVLELQYVYHSARYDADFPVFVTVHGILDEYSLLNSNFLQEEILHDKTTTYFMLILNYDYPTRLCL